MKVLVAVASKHGSTREIATVIAEELRLQNLTVDLLEAGEVGDVEGYSAVILGSAVYANNWMEDAKQFAGVYGEELAMFHVPIWLFSSGPLGTGEAGHRAKPEELARSLGEAQAEVRDHKIFAGNLNSEGLSFVEHMIVQVVHAPLGDFRDWNEVRTWAREIAAEMAVIVAH